MAQAVSDRQSDTLIRHLQAEVEYLRGELRRKDEERRELLITWNRQLELMTRALPAPVRDLITEPIGSPIEEAKRGSQEDGEVQGTTGGAEIPPAIPEETAGPGGDYVPTQTRRGFWAWLTGRR